MAKLRRLVGILAALAALLVFAPPGAVAAQPFTQTDLDFLAALSHGGLCCPQQPDSPIWHDTAMAAVNRGRDFAYAFAANPTYQNFQTMKSDLYWLSRAPNNHPMDTFSAGEFLVVAVHYYAGPAVECNLMTEMGGAAGEASYWYGPPTYSGGLEVQPGCIT